MPFKSIGEIKKFISQYEELQRSLEPIANTLLELRHSKSKIDFEDIQIQTGGIFVDYEEYEGCGNYTEHSMQIPIEYLFEKDWVETAKKKIEERAVKETIKRQLYLEIKKQEQHKKDIETYQKLKEKLGK